MTDKQRLAEQKRLSAESKVILKKIREQSGSDFKRLAEIMKQHNAC